MLHSEVVLTPEQIERFRQIGLRLDRNGEFWHDGARVEHGRLRKALLRWLDVLDDGRDVVRLDDNRYAYVYVEDAHLIVRSLVWEGDRAWLQLNDDSGEELAYDSLCLGANGATYVRVRNGKLRARLSTAAHLALATHLEAEDADNGPYHLRAAGTTYPIIPAPGQATAVQF